ncbi:hypothetical protein SDC9_84493 [bioreactor metagenome]|uniref:Uncharacterized protein n=1 Tax=bioreactor metagenome TaxID=1076179 RepID=A0A644ZJD2_9ZZZZ|nr:DUF6056 family protein [Oscillospiraceae bacterium]
MKSIITKKNIFSVICLIASLACLIIIINNILLYADDYYYGTFFRDGFISFIMKNVEHYKTFNGRVIVHLLAEAIIPLGTVVFSIVAGMILYASFYFSSKAFSHNSAFFIALSFSAVLLIPVRILRESLLWRSAFFNYVYPSFMIIMVLWFLKRNVTKGKIPVTGVFLLFLCGATTEQCGFAAICLTLSVTLSEIKYKNINIKEIILKSCLPCFLGWITVMLSPATITRAGRENSCGIENLLGKINPAEILNRLWSLSKQLFSPQGAGLFCVLIALASFIAIKSNKTLRHISFFWGCLLGTYLLWQTDSKALCISIFVLNTVYTVYLIYILIKTESLRYQGILLITAYASVFVMLGTESIYPRTFLPFILLIIPVISSFLTEAFSEKTFFPAIAAVIGVAVIFPTIKGYVYNKSIDNINISNVRNSGQKISYCLDYDDLYRHTMMQDDGYFYQTFREYYRIEENSLIDFCGKNMPCVFVNGKYIGYPAAYINNKLYIPIELVLKELGGTEAYYDGMTHFSYKNVEYIYDSKAKNISCNDGKYIKNVSLGDKVISAIYFSIPSDIACEIFDLDVKVDGKGNIEINS